MRKNGRSAYRCGVSLRPSGRCDSSTGTTCGQTGEAPRCPASALVGYSVAAADACRALSEGTMDRGYTGPRFASNPQEVHISWAVALTFRC